MWSAQNPDKWRELSQIWKHEMGDDGDDGDDDHGAE